MAVQSGLATFSNLSLDKVGGGYVLTASDGTLSNAASNGFNITVGVAAKLAFGQQPSNAAAGASISPAVTVFVQDAMGNTITGDTSSVTLTITTNPGSGTLSGTATVAAANGLATFNNLSINKSGAGYVLTASDGTLSSGTSSAFNIAAGPAAQLAFGQPPGNTAAGSNISPAVTVLVQDTYGNTVSGDTSSVTVALTANPGSGTLSGNKTVAAQSGLATFNNLSLNQVGSGYVLTATDGSLTSVSSAGFNITPGAAAKLVFSLQPSSTPAGASITPTVAVLVQDANGNTATNDSSTVTLSIGTNPPGNGTLSGKTAVAAVNGAATFSGLSIDKAGTGYTLTASDGGLSSATSNGFNISAGAATKLVFGQQPTSALAGAGISPAVTVLVQDAFGNTVINDSSSVTVSLGTNPGNGNAEREYHGSGGKRGGDLQRLVHR